MNHASWQNRQSTLSIDKKPLRSAIACAAIATASITLQAQASVQTGNLYAATGQSGYQEWVGTDSDLVLWLADTSASNNGSALINLSTVSGLSVADAFNGGAFQATIPLGTGAGQIDISTGLYDSWGLFGMSRQVSTSYGLGLAGEIYGALYSGSEVLANANAIGHNESLLTSALQPLHDWMQHISNQFGPGQSYETVSSNNLAHWNHNPVRQNYIAPLPIGNELQNIYLWGILDPTPEPIFDHNIIDHTSAMHTVQSVAVSITSDNAFLVVGNSVPLPGAAWLFLSATALIFSAKKRGA